MVSLRIVRVSRGKTEGNWSWRKQRLEHEFTTTLSVLALRMCNLRREMTTRHSEGGEALTVKEGLRMQNRKVLNVDC
jgi:hypothetical protein